MGVNGGVRRNLLINLTVTETTASKKRKVFFILAGSKIVFDSAQQSKAKKGRRQQTNDDNESFDSPLAIVDVAAYYILPSLNKPKKG